MTDENESGYSIGDSYDDAIVGIAIGADSSVELDAEEIDDGFDDLVAGITAAIDDADVDREETWLRKCTGEVPNSIETNQNDFARLPPEVQMKLVLDLKESEKATLLKSLRECSSVVERLKEQLYESEDKRMELEHELDTENTEVQEMKREFKEMKEAHKCRIRDIERIANEMLVQRERLCTIIEQRQRSLSIVSSSTPTTLPCPSEHSETSQDNSSTEASAIAGAQHQNSSLTSESSKSELEIEFDRKLQVDPQYREEFERFKEFQVYYEAVTRNHLQRTGDDSSIDEKDITRILSWGEEYRKMLEFQLAYERMLSFVQNNRKNS